MEKQNINPVLTVDFKHTFSSNGDVENSSRVCLDITAIQGGLLKEVGANRIAILLAIVSHMDVNGQAFPSQERIAEITGQGRATVQRNLDALCEVEFNGQKLLFKELVGDIRKKTLYTINQAFISNTDSYDEKPALEPEPEIVIKNAKDAGLYFLQVFEESFGYKYNMMFNKELPLIKTKLISNYDGATIKAMIDIGVGQYKQRWANENYPHPSVSMLCGWVGNKALAIHKQEQDKAAQLEEKIVKAQEQDDTDRALDLFDL